MVTCTNCVVAFDTNSYTEDYSAITYASFENCIIGDIGKDSFHSGLTFTNCIGLIIGGDEGLGDVTTFEGASEESTGNIAGINQEEVFKTFHTSDWNGALLDNNETFELTETAAATYLGTDGTQVGMHGGSVPFSRTIYPRITKFEVAPKAVDGKVKVNVEVNGGE